MTAATILIALTVALSISMGPREAAGFIRIMGGGSDSNCGFEGSFCYSDTVCCDAWSADTVIRNSVSQPREVHFISLGYGGVCEREMPRYYDFGMPRRIDCQVDSDCPPGQCCVSSALGIRGSSIRSCKTDCSMNEKDLGTLLGEYYSRYYRSSYARSEASMKTKAEAELTLCFKRQSEANREAVAIAYMAIAN
uniref:CC domain-containing protein n=1 Tax=Macrostomum lignano TaxID=282301 RepID=A0A1I8JNY7_9PLAT